MFLVLVHMLLNMPTVKQNKELRRGNLDKDSKSPKEMIHPVQVIIKVVISLPINQSNTPLTFDVRIQFQLYLVLVNTSQQDQIALLIQIADKLKFFPSINATSLLIQHLI